MSGAINTTGLCTVRDCVALMKADKLTECELTFDLDGEKVNVMVSIAQPIRIVLPPMTETESDKQWHVIPQKIWHIEQSPDEKLVHDLVAVMKKIRNASDDLSAYYGGIDGRTELDKAIAEADAVLADVGAKEA